MRSSVAGGSRRGFTVVRVAIATLGCKVNHYESAGIEEEIRSRGFSIVPFRSEADIYIVNTCTVTGKTDYQSRQLIRRANRTNPEASIFVTGCYAQIAPEILAALPGVTMVVGTRQKAAIPDLLSSEAGKETIINVKNINDERFLSCLSVTDFHGQTRAYLKIQDGCNAFCSYCIIPYARGRTRSLPENRIIEEIRSLYQAGYREIILTGIHLGMYGHELSPRTSLSDLLSRIEKETDIERLRISSTEPMEITDGIIELIRESSILCRHLHIPLQSGNDKILKAMNRNYDSRQFEERIETIVQEIPDIGIGIDIIAGFPGESEEKFENTRAFIERLPIQYLHVFPYSKRPGTAAFSLSDHVPENIKKERARILREIDEEKRASFSSRFVGKRLSVLVEGKKDRKSGLMKGFSDNYIPILIEEANQSMTNCIVEVEGTETFDKKLKGKIVSHE
ncbi:MAG: tRNA (N(6)-L-threonylcarbamoyladenosine(37)-C(2))-methylthiotransferase MtaB [Deltaproteobacteria bacterium]|nr:tRNA (N(6)-L-threonylcarbamoyladenosine(37)-C(2))-methylthiotransferase MtaB [Deltaproteobacteria bacterium]